MGVNHILHRVGYHIARRERVEHTVVSHGDTVVNGYGVEFRGIASHSLYLALHSLSYLVEMGMSGNKLCERVNDGYDGFAKLLALHSVRHP